MTTTATTTTATLALSQDTTLPSLQQHDDDDDGENDSTIITSSSFHNNSNNTTSGPRFPRNWLQTLLSKHPNPTTPPDLAGKALVVAPMVDQSDLPFRLLCRQYGANLAVTPMIHSKLFATRKSYAKKFFNLCHGTPPQDRPLLAQLCGSELKHVLKTALALQPHVDGIDLNCGCPQQIAKKGQYGAFLLEREDVLVPLVRTLSRALSIPLSVKVRLLPSGTEDSLRLYQRLTEAGASMITIHGRTRLQKGSRTGHADWEAIRRAVELLSDNVPVLANGSMSQLDEVRACLECTGADGVMCSEALLEYPALFFFLAETNNTRLVHHKRTGPGRVELAQRYMDLAREYPPDEGGQGSGIKCVRIHLHRFLHADLQVHTELRTKLSEAKTMEALQEIIDAIKAIHQEFNHKVEEEQLSWYVRHRSCNEKGDNDISEAAHEGEKVVETTEVMDDAAHCRVCLFGEDDDDEEWSNDG